jgi:NADPH-dependent curcumin reductase CurA
VSVEERAHAAAHDAVEAVEPQHGETVLVSGATGVGIIVKGFKMLFTPRLGGIRG